MLLFLLPLVLYSFTIKKFDEIKALTSDVITFFGSSSSLTDAQREVIDGVAAVHNNTFLVDKDDEANAQIFETPDLQDLPALYVLVYEELNAEKYRGEFTLADISEYIRYKFAPYNESLVVPDASLENVMKAVDNGTHSGAAVLFVSRKKCAACPSTAISILRSATRLHAAGLSVQFYALNCDDMLKDCGTVHIDRVPTFTVYSNGIWTHYKGSQAGADVDAFVQEEIKADKETLERRREAQDKTSKEFDEHIKQAEEKMKKGREDKESVGPSVPNTATRSRMLALEKRVAELEKKLEKTKGKKAKGDKKEL